MPHSELWAGALSLIVRYSETGCLQSGRQAACLLDHLVELPGLDHETSALLERASLRLGDQLQKETMTCVR
jgi:hypothetical protein